MGKRTALLTAVLGAGLLAYSCGGGGGTSGGTVTTYITDTPEDFMKLEVGIREVSLLNTGTGAECVVFSSDPAYRIDLIEVRNVLQLLDVSNCPAGPYNRLRIVMDKSPVEVIDEVGTSYTCELVDHDPDQNPNIPNEVHCDPAGNTCYVLVNGAVNVLTNSNTDLILDFELKDSEVNLSSDPCTVTFKVSPLHDRGERYEELEGRISCPDNGTFEITGGHGMTFTVDYSQIQGIDNLLQFACEHSAKVEVECQSLSMSTAHCQAKEIEVEVRGTVDKINGGIYTIRMDQGTTISVELEQGKEPEGDVNQGTEVEVELVGYDGSNDVYIASEIEKDW
jgi:hypothetical protein